MVVEYKPNWGGRKDERPDENVPGGGEETYGVSNKIIDKPRGGYTEEPDPVAFEDQPVGNLGVLHGITFEPLGFIHVYSPNQDGESRDHTEAKGDTPNSPEVVGTETMTHW